MPRRPTPRRARSPARRRGSPASPFSGRRRRRWPCCAAATVGAFWSRRRARSPCRRRCASGSRACALQARSASRSMSIRTAFHSFPQPRRARRTVARGGPDVLGTAWISRGGSAPRRWRAEIRKPQTSAAAALAGAAIEDCFSLAAKATGVSGLAERYAAALFELADERRMLDPVAADLRALQAMIGESADLVRLLRSPILSRAAQEKAIAALAERAGLSPLVRDFLRVAARNRRLFAVPAMTAAQPLSPAQLERLGEELRRARGRRVAVVVRVDRGLLGGLVVKVGSRMVDGSLRSKLARLQLAMKGPG